MHQLAFDESLKWVVSSAIQLFLGISASILAWRLGRDTSDKANQELKVKLYDRRYAVYLAFKAFIQDCLIQDVPPSIAITSFTEETKRIEFLFGGEIVGYQKEVLANALAIVGITSGAPCSSSPSVGGIVGYFPGSTILPDLNALRAWFFRQHQSDLMRYFAPYLDFARAGVDPKQISMRPPRLPDAPLVKREISEEEYQRLHKASQEKHVALH
jgi:hypothetical protein